MPDQTLQEIKDRLDISEVIGDYIQLKKAGVNYKGVCPFHNEKTASLIVSPAKQIWHCFGCGEGGDIFGFVKKFENLEFKETLKILADKAGVSLPVYSAKSRQTEDLKTTLVKINDFAARLYHKVLISEKEGQEALEYLKQRGLTEKTIQQWKVGFAPESFHFLEKSLAKKSVKAEDLVKAGVSVKHEKGQIYDRFRGRITFPIFNYFGEIVGFSARILPKLGGGKAAKYINSPETLIYKKSEVLFGLNFAKDDIRKKDEMIIVEGQMDCISLHQSGFKNVIAASGTAYNQQAVAFTGARRLTKNIKFCFDTDSAGKLALRRAGEMLLKLGFRIKVILLKSVKDPDELVRKSPGLWSKAVSESVWFLDYYINMAKENFPEDVLAQKHYLSEEVVPFLRFIKDSLEQDHYINELVQKFGISEKIIREQIKGLGSVKAPESDLKKTSVKSREPFLVLEKQVLGGIIKYSDFLKLILEHGKVEDFEDFEIRKALGEVLKQKSLTFMDLNSVLAKEALFMVESRLDELNGDEKLFKKELKKIFITLKISSLKNCQNRLSSDIKRVENLKDEAGLKKLQKEFAEISALKFNLEKEL